MALAIWQGAPRDETKKAAQAFGVSPEALMASGDELPRDEVIAVEVWPENEVPMRVFRAMRTQWRIGFGGPYAMDYTVIEFVARQVGVGSRALKASFEALQVMEAAVVELIASRKRD